MKKYLWLASLFIVLIIATPAQAATFSDVSKTTESGKAISNLVDRKVVDGYTDGTFRPKEFMTRAQAAKIISNMLQVKPTYFMETTFIDVAPTNPYYEAIATVADLGIMSGYADESFRPNEKVTRSQAAKIISETFRLRHTKVKLPFKDIKSEETQFYVANLYANKVTKSKDSKFKPNTYVTRADFSLYLVRAEKQQQAYTKYAYNEQYAAFGYTEYDEDIVDVELDMYRLTLHPLQEGTARLAVYSMDEYEQFERHFYLVHVTKKNGKFSITLEEENIYDHISYATSVYHYREGLYLKFVPNQFEIFDENGLTIPEDQYEIIFNDEEIEVTMFKDGAFQLYFSNETERSSHAILSIVENFILDFTIETISPFIEITDEHLDFKIDKVSIVNYLNYEENEGTPFTATFIDGTIKIQPQHIGEGVIRVVDKNGQKHYIDVIVHKKAGILVVDAAWG